MYFYQWLCLSYTWSQDKNIDDPRLTALNWILIPLTHTVQLILYIHLDLVGSNSVSALESV